MKKKFYKALIVDKNTEGEIETVRYSSTYYVDAGTAKIRYGECFLRLDPDSVIEIEVPK